MMTGAEVLSYHNRESGSRLPSGEDEVLQYVAFHRWKLTREDWLADWWFLGLVPSDPIPDPETEAHVREMLAAEADWLAQYGVEPPEGYEWLYETVADHQDWLGEGF